MLDSRSYFRNGNTSRNRILSCDSVTDGAFFPQPNLQVPEEEVGEHTCDHVVMPTHEFSDFVMVHA
jgi:hypothetical protein